MGAQSDGDEDEITGINVTPLVDVMLVLLVIFMVTASHVVHKTIDIKLPQAETGENTDVSKNLAFVLDKDSRLFLDGELIDFPQVAEQIEKARKDAQSGAQLQALITADQETPHGAVVKLIDTVRQSGITEFAMNVEAPAGDEEIIDDSEVNPAE
ncbi:MAG: ExbD/TolR family protein [Oligoflexales bacterium]